MKKLFIAILLTLMIVTQSPAQTLGNSNGSGPFAPGAAYSYNQFLGPFFQNPFFSFTPNSLVVTWTQGYGYFGNGFVNIAPGSVTLTASKTTCSRANIIAVTDSCNYIYANTSGVVAVTTAIATAMASGNSLLAVAVTNGTGVTSLQAPYQDTSGGGGGATSTSTIVLSASCTPAATSAAIQTTAQTCTFTGLNSGDLAWLMSSPAPTSLCPPTLIRATGANTLSIYFTTLTAVACTPASGTYVIGVLR
jgi:hypothetical protein